MFRNPHMADGRPAPPRIPLPTSSPKCKSYTPLSVDRIQLWVYYNKIPGYPIFYLLKGDDKPQGLTPKPSENL